MDQTVNALESTYYGFIPFSTSSSKCRITPRGFRKYSIPKIETIGIFLEIGCSISAYEEK